MTAEYFDDDRPENEREGNPANFWLSPSVLRSVELDRQLAVWTAQYFGFQVPVKAELPIAYHDPYPNEGE